MYFMNFFLKFWALAVLAFHFGKSSILFILSVPFLSLVKIHFKARTNPNRKSHNRTASRHFTKYRTVYIVAQKPSSNTKGQYANWRCKNVHQRRRLFAQNAAFNISIEYISKGGNDGYWVMKVHKSIITMFTKKYEWNVNIEVIPISRHTKKKWKN